jgi:hypothetical protein
MSLKMNYDQFRSEYRQWYLESLKNELSNLDASYRPSDDRCIEIAKTSFDQLISDDLISKLFDEVSKQDLGPVDDDLEWRTPRWLRDLDPTTNKNVCIGLSMAAAAALLAAWVASGGTLTVGMIAGGVKITSPIYAALVGGGGAAAVASAMC